MISPVGIFSDPLRRLAAAAILAAMCLGPHNTFAASDMISLQEEVDDNGRGDEFALIRCAAFYLSVFNYTGEENLPAETAAQTKTTVERLLNSATELREASAEPSDTTIVQDILAASDKYLMRYQMNYDASGDAFSTDPLWISDADTCSLVRDAVMQ